MSKVNVHARNGLDHPKQRVYGRYHRVRRNRHKHAGSLVGIDDCLAGIGTCESRFGRFSETPTPTGLGEGVAANFQRRRDDNKNESFRFLRGGGLGGREENRPKRCFFCFRGKRHDNKILEVQILLSRNLVVIAQAPKFVWGLGSPEVLNARARRIFKPLLL